MSTSTFKLGAAMAAAALLGGVGATAANAAFNDVNENGPFAEHVTNVQEAGIATGYSDGSFRPQDPINRQQAATWIDRAASRAALDFADEDGENDPVNPGDPTRQVATVEVSSPASDLGGGWVTLEGYVAAATQAADGTGCPCAMDVRVLDGNGDEVAISAMTVPGPAMDDERAVGGPVGISPLSGIVYLPGGTSDTYTLEVELVDGDVGNVFVAGTLSALYTPMAEGDPAVHGAGPASGPASLVPEG